MAERLRPPRLIALLLSALVLLPACVAPSGCTDRAPSGVPGTMDVKIADRTFSLELATTNAKRVQGLSGRTEIADDGGMLFSFKRASVQRFVMRDCFVPIDIIYLDASGRITAMHAMQVEPERGEGEGEIGERNLIYEDRLKKYSSKFGAKYVIELKGGVLESLELSEADQIRLDHDALAAITE